MIDVVAAVNDGVVELVASVEGAKYYKLASAAVILCCLNDRPDLALDIWVLS